MRVLSVRRGALTATRLRVIRSTHREPCTLPARGSTGNLTAWMIAWLSDHGKARV
jgi:hypothetical protein